MVTLILVGILITNVYELSSYAVNSYGSGIEIFLAMMIIGSVFHSVGEFMNVEYNVNEYFREIWNCLDLISISFLSVWLCLNFQEGHGTGAERIKSSETSNTGTSLATNTNTVAVAAAGNVGFRPMTAIQHAPINSTFSPIISPLSTNTENSSLGYNNNNNKTGASVFSFDIHSKHMAGEGGLHSRIGNVNSNGHGNGGSGGGSGGNSLGTNVSRDMMMMMHNKNKKKNECENDEDDDEVIFSDEDRERIFHGIEKKRSYFRRNPYAFEIHTEIEQQMQAMDIKFSTKLESMENRILERLSAIIDDKNHKGIVQHIDANNRAHIAGALTIHILNIDFYSNKGKKFIKNPEPASMHTYLKEKSRSLIANKTNFTVQKAIISKLVRPSVEKFRFIFNYFNLRNFIIGIMPASNMSSNRNKNRQSSPIQSMVMTIRRRKL
eukprot:gene1145-2212_t